MSGRKFYCFCDANCKFETMNKEQILAALSDLMTSAHVEDGCLFLDFDASAFEGMDDGAFITKVKESNAGGDVSFWVGTEAQFNAIAPTVEADSVIARIDKNGKVYICTDDSFIAFLRRTVQADKIMVGDEALTADTIHKLRNGLFDASYTLGDNQGDYTLQRALIEQASEMDAGTERLVYFYDNVPAWFQESGFAIAKLYFHEGYEQGGRNYVSVDIYSGKEKYYMTVVMSDTDGKWSCTDMVRVMNSENVGIAYASYTIDSRESFNAAMIEQASKMKIGAERLVYFHDQVPTVFYNGYALAKLYTVAARELETGYRVCADIYTGSKWFMTVTKDNAGAWTCSDIVRVATSADLENYYTAQEVDDKLAVNGMVKVFEYLSGDASSSVEIPDEKLSVRLITVTVTRVSTDGSLLHVYPFTIDWNVWQRNGKRSMQVGEDYCHLYVSKTAAGVRFSAQGQWSYDVESVCGYR